MVEAVYKPRKPKASPLYQSISEHFSEFESVCLVTDGCFMPNGWFYVLPKIDVKKLESLFRHKILKLLLSEKKISGELVEKLLSWKNSGFSVHNCKRGRRGVVFLSFIGLSDQGV